MGSMLGRMISSKPYGWFWLGFTVTFAVLDFMTGSLFMAVLMAGLAVLWARNLKTIYQGNNAAYNRHHGNKE